MPTPPSSPEPTPGGPVGPHGAPEPEVSSPGGALVPALVALLAAGALAWWLTRAPAPPPERPADPPTTGARAPGRTTEAPRPEPAAMLLPLALTEGDEPLDDSLPPLPGSPPAQTAAILPAHAGQSVGTPQSGRLTDGVDLSSQPEPALRVLPATERRGYTRGTAELVTLLTDTARAVTRAFPGTQLTVGNLSRPGGGDIPQSVSHNSGRDADLALFAVDREGRPLQSAHYVVFDAHGVAVAPPDLAGVARFDEARTWAAVRHLLSHPAVVVQWIFVAAPLRNMLLDHALRIDEPELLRERARRVLVQPSDSSPHVDHLHVRIACPPDDRPACVDGAGRTALARAAQVDALLRMYHHGSPAEQRYARDLLSLPFDGAELVLPPVEDDDHGETEEAAP